MTALEKFIKQIVLKTVKGSVYLVPAICDFQITEALEEDKKQEGVIIVQGEDGRLYYPESVEEWISGDLKQKGDRIYLSKLIKTI